MGFVIASRRPGASPPPCPRACVSEPGQPAAAVRLPAGTWRACRPRSTACPTRCWCTATRPRWGRVHPTAPRRRIGAARLGAGRCRLLAGCGRAGHRRRRRLHRSATIPAGQLPAVRPGHAAPPASARRRRPSGACNTVLDRRQRRARPGGSGRLMPGQHDDPAVLELEEPRAGGNSRYQVMGHRLFAGRTTCRCRATTRTRSPTWLEDRPAPACRAAGVITKRHCHSPQERLFHEGH